MQWAALAAVVSALAIGMWLGRSVLPSQQPVRVAEEALNRRAAEKDPPSRPATEGFFEEALNRRAAETETRTLPQR
jgi:hypothetical protein